MAKTLRKKVHFTMTVTILLFLCICVALTALFLRHRNRIWQTDLMEAVGAAAATMIDADAAKDYLTLRQTDAAYDSVQQQLTDYVRECGEPVLRLSLVSFSNTMGSYIYDTGSNPLGSKLEYDDSLLTKKAELINGHNTWMEQKGSSLFLFRPVRTVDDRLTGYLICELDNSIQKQVLFYALLLFVGLLALGVCIILLFMYRMQKKLFLPLSRFTKAAQDFSEEGKMPPAELFSGEQADEIAQIGSAFRKMFTDISNGAETLSKAVYDANHDGMTKVYNKAAYADMLEKFQSCHSICVVYFDVNNLKLMNDTLGHERGDYVICQAAEYIRSFLTPLDYCFRMGGDEFLMVMTECSYRTIDAMVEKLEADAPYILSEETDSVQCAISYGYAYAKGTYSFEALLVEAEENMYVKKTELKSLMHMPER